MVQLLRQERGIGRREDESDVVRVLYGSVHGSNTYSRGRMKKLVTWQAKGRSFNHTSVDEERRGGHGVITGDTGSRSIKVSKPVIDMVQ